MGHKYREISLQLVGLKAELYLYFKLEIDGIFNSMSLNIKFSATQLYLFLFLCNLVLYILYSDTARLLSSRQLVYPNY